MDTKELLTQVVDGIINEDDAAATKAFGQFATLKLRSILEGSKKPAKKDEEEECTDEEKAKAIVDIGGDD